MVSTDVSFFFQAYHNKGIMNTQQLLVPTDRGASMDVLPLEPERRKKRRKNRSEESDQKTKQNEEKGQTSLNMTMTEASAPFVGRKWSLEPF